MSYLSWSDVRRWPTIRRERWERLLGLASGAGAVLASAVFLSAIDRVLAPAAPREPAASLSRVAGFEVNRGQADAAVRFLSRADGFLLSLAPTEAHLRPACPRQQCGPIRLRLVGAGASRLVAQQPLPGSTYASVLYEEVYPGVGLRFVGYGGELSYTFLVDRGASAQSIVLELDGVDRVELDVAGALMAAGSSAARLMLPAPAAWQLEGKQRVPVEARYTVRGRQIGIETGPYDVRRPLEISGGRGRLIDPHAAGS